MREYVVDVSGATSWPDTICAFNEGLFCHVGGQWDGNLDVFNDYLWWPDEHPYRLVIRGWAACAQAVTRVTRDGQPVIEVLEDIFRENPQVEVVLA